MLRAVESGATNAVRTGCGVSLRIVYAGFRLFRAEQCGALLNIDKDIIRARARRPSPSLLRLD